jgi:HK97 family phage major capsid protein
VPFNNIISRTDADPLIPEDVVAEVIKATTAESAALTLLRRVDMGTKLATLPVLSALAQAYWVAGDTGLKQTTELAWNGIVLTAEELACLVPVPEAVVDDASGIDFWAEVQQGMAEAVGIALDQAVFSGIGKPASWPDSIVGGATTAGNTVASGTATAEQGGIVGDIDAALDLVEADGFDPSGIAAKRSLRGMLRRARDANGQRLADLTAGTVEGLPVAYVGGGVFDATTLAVTGDFTMAVLGLRSDMQFKILDQAVITDAAGAVIYNLPQQDMLAMRVTFRAAYATANPITRRDDAATGAFPFAAVTQTAA